MEKIFSARLDEAVLDELDRVTRRLAITKKQFLEEAIRMRASSSAMRKEWTFGPRRWGRGFAERNPRLPSAGHEKNSGSRSNAIIAASMRAYGNDKDAAAQGGRLARP